MAAIEKFVLLVLLVTASAYGQDSRSFERADGQTLSVKEINSKRILITWPQSGSWNNVTKYNVTATMTDNPDPCASTNVTCNNGMCSFDSSHCFVLNPCSTVNFTVANEGNSSMISVETAAPPPGNLVCINGTDIKATWSQPENSPCVESYRISYTGDILWSNGTDNGATKSTVNETTLTGLIPYTNYTVSVAGLSGAGKNTKGDVALCYDSTTSQSVPSKPKFLSTKTKSTSNSVTLEWTPPKDRNGILLNYILSWTWGNNTNNTSIDDTQTKHEIQGLDSETSFTFTLKAVNGAGASEHDSITAMTETAIDDAIMPAGIVLSVLGGVLPVLAIIGVAIYLANK